jgi:hypothetical protein
MVCETGMTTGELFDWLLKALTAIGTVSAVVFVLFQEKWRKWNYHPTINVSAITKPPDCVKIPYVQTTFLPGMVHSVIRRETTSYYLRALVENIGNETARNVEIYAKELKRESKDGRWERVEDFPPMNLTWSNPQPEHASSLPSLPPGSRRHCDVGHILDPKDQKSMEAEDRSDLELEAGMVSLTFDLINRPLHLGHIVKPGRYRLAIEVAADNFDAVVKEVEINFDGRWNGDQRTMFADHVGIKVAP